MPSGLRPMLTWLLCSSGLLSGPHTRPLPGGGGGAVHLLCPVLESQAHLFPLEVTHFLTSLLKRPLLIILHASTCFPLERVSNA